MHYIFLIMFPSIVTAYLKNKPFHMLAAAKETSRRFIDDRNSDFWSNDINSFY